MYMHYIDTINQVKNTKILATLYPTTKFILTIYLILVDIILNTFSFTLYNLRLLLFPYFVALLVLMILSGIKKNGYKLVSSIAMFSLFVAIFQVAFCRQGNAILSLNFLQITDTALSNSITLGMNTLNISTIVICFFQITDIEDITISLNKLGMSNKTCFIILSTFQTIDYLQMQIKAIITSQKSRGINFNGNLIRRIGTFTSILLPAFITSLINIEQRIMMLDSRNFFSSEKKTYIKQVNHNGHEKLVLTIGTITLVFLILGRVIYGYII